MLAKFTRIIKPYRWPLLSGFLIGTTYIPFPPWASLFCFVPLWIFCLENKDNLKRLSLGAWLTGFVLTLIGFNWVALTIHEFGMMPWPVAILALLAFAGFANLDLALAAVIWGLLQKKLNLKKPASWALLAVLTAIFEAHFPSIFEWNYGYTFFWSGLPIYQLGELIGFQGISSLIILLNFWALLAAKDAPRRGRRIAEILGAFIILNLLGWSLVKSLPEPDQKIRLGIVQANIGNLQKQFAEQGRGFREHILNKYLGLSEQLVKEEPDLNFVVWPETAFPSTIYDTGFGDHHVGELKKRIAEIGIPFLIGGYGLEQNTRKPKNAIFAIDDLGIVHPEHYFKTHLLAFGEYIPGVESFPILRKYIPASEFAWGPGPKVIEFKDQRIGLQICYESLFPKFSIGLADLGAQWILNVTNDSWYGTWQEPYQHLMMTLARAIEIRRPLVRATNTGISTVVLADGTILERSPMEVEWSAAYEMPYLAKPVPTVYQRWPWITDALLLLLAALFLWSAGFDRIRKH